MLRWSVLSAVVVLVAGHGRVLQPPSRASMWRYGFPTKYNYDDDGLNCGGFSRQYDRNDGKCGICGDAYDADKPRAHEIGGTYGQGIIVAEYESGQVFSATVEITAYHKGYWYFQICPDPSSSDQSCFDEYPVELEEGGTKYYPPKGGSYTVNYRLPKGLFCEHCVLQWRYVAGNNWGYCNDGTSGLGCGNQENFLACTDISIKPVVVPDVPIEILPLKGVDQGLLDLLRNMILRPPPKKYNTKLNLNNKKNYRQPRTKNKPSKRKKVPFWPPY